jgi:TM2 domain-containing membrane protein YozV
MTQIQRHILHRLTLRRTARQSRHILPIAALLSLVDDLTYNLPLQPVPQPALPRNRLWGWLSCPARAVSFAPDMNMNARPDTHSKIIGYLLWLFGFTGSHRFYYGKPVSGTIWFFTLGLFLIGWIVDLFLIPSMDRAADRRFVAGPIDYSVAWILMTFLGLFGVHRFYMGKWGTGLLYLLTLGLLGIGWLYDFWTLNAQISERNHSRYVR